MSADAAAQAAAARSVIAYFQQYAQNSGYDEMFAADGSVRPHYMALFESLAQMSPSQFERVARTVDVSFKNLGITFTVYSDLASGIERLLPFDPLPRILPEAEWDHLERGIVQRVTAINMFLHDLYHRQLILQDRVLEPYRIFTGANFRREMIGVDVPRDVYTHITGIDLVRTAEGHFAVLEDNCRVPSGVSYLLANRMVMKRVFPNLFSHYQVRSVDEYPSMLRDALQYVAPSSAEDKPTIVLLTPGIYNSAYFEHTYLAQHMGVSLVEGRDLLVDSNTLYMRTIAGLQKVDVVYRRIDDDFIDPLTYRRDSLLGPPGLMHAVRAGNVTLANAIGTGIADDKGIYPFIPAIIRYYLGEDAILPNIPTYVMTDAAQRQHTLVNLERMVVKRVNEAGGYGMLFGPQSTARQRAEFAEQIEANPRDFIAQDVIELSSSPCLVDGAFEPRRVDLRPYVIYGEKVRVIPGGFTRVAMQRGSYIVNSSQGGGSKDTWVLR